MQRVLATRFLKLALLCAFVSGCTSTYWANRGRDFADPLTVQGHSNQYGLSARVGPIKVGASYRSEDSKTLGLYGGSLEPLHTAEFTAVFFGADYVSVQEIRFDDWKPEAEDGQENATDAQSIQDLLGPSGERAIHEARQKVYRARAPFGTERSAHLYRNLLKDDDVDFAPPTYFTQIEINLGAYLGFTFGINPGEVLDFLLGWFGADIMSDDAPYPSRLDELRDSEYWDLLDEDTREQLIEAARERGL